MVVVVAAVDCFLVRMGVGIAMLKFDFGGMVIVVVCVDNDASLLLFTVLCRRCRVLFCFASE